MGLNDIGSKYRKSLSAREFDSFDEAADGRPVKRVKLVDAEVNINGDMNVDVAAFVDASGNQKDALVDADGHQQVDILTMPGASGDISTVTATGATAINTLTTIGAKFKLSKVVVHLSSAPTTSENLTVTLDSNAGSAYDTVLFSVDPSESSSQDIVYVPEGDMQFVSGDELQVSYNNTDAVTYGLTIYYQLV